MPLLTLKPPRLQPEQRLETSNNEPATITARIVEHSHTNEYQRENIKRSPTNQHGLKASGGIPHHNLPKEYRCYDNSVTSVHVSFEDSVEAARALWRHHVLLAKTKAIIKIQSLYRQRVARMEYLERYHAMLAALNHRELQDAEIAEYEISMRDWRAQRKSRAVKKMKAMVNVFQAKRIFKHRRLERRALVKLQSLFRGAATRDRFRGLKTRTRAAVIIQRFVRVWLAIRAVRALRNLSLAG